MNIARRLALLLALPLLALIALGVFLHLQLGRVEDRGRYVAEMQIPSIAAIGHITRAYGELRVDARDYVNAPGQTQRDGAIAHFNATEDRLKQFFEQYAAHLISDERDGRLMQQYRALTREWSDGVRQAMAIAPGGQREAALNRILGHLRDLAEQINGVSVEWIRHNEHLANEAAARVVATVDRVRLQVWGAGAAAVFITALLGLVTFRRIVTPIRSLESSVKRIAAGEYAQPVPYTEATDETGSLARSVAQLKQAAAQTQVQSKQLASQAEEMRRINLLSDAALDLTKTSYWHLSFAEPDYYHSSPRGARLLGQEPVPDFRYRVADWQQQVRLGDPVAADSAFAAFEAIVAGQSEHYSATYAFKRPVDGRVIWLRSAGHVTRDDAGRPVEIFGVNQDITEAKLAEFAIREGERQVRETEQYFRGVLEKAPDGLLVVDAGGTIRLANAQCEKLFGYTRDELVGQKVEMLVPAAVRPHHPGLREGYHRDATARAMGAKRELHAQRKDGSLFPVDIGLSPLAPRNGEAPQIAVSIRDITERKQQEAELAFRLTFQQALLTTLPYPMFFKDSAGRFLGCNRAYEHEFGTTSDFLKGKTVMDLDYLPEEDRRKFHAEDMAVINSADRRSYELPIRYSDGRIHTTLYSVDGFRLADGTPGGLIGLLVDITDQKEAAEALKAARRKAEDATQMKSMFLANMSHEIRTPMNAIIGLSYLALKTPLNAKQRDYVGKVHNAGTSLLAIINDILDFSKIEAGRLELEHATFRLDDVLTSVTTLTAQKAHEKGLEFLARIGPDIAEHLRGDPLRLGQILTNLVNNSVKFTERGEIQLTVELAERTGDKCQLRFAVRDTGMGMTHEQSQRLFQPFVQADMSTTRKHGGTGLGLTICRRLVELMGGQIWLESAPGAGTTFTFTVWLGIGDQPAARRIIPEKLTKIRALIVDDNQAAREIIDDLVEGIVLHADAVGSGPEAISAVRQNDADAPYDVVFMDWRMPGMDGLQTARTIKSDPALRHPPAVIMITAFGREEVRDEAEQLGLDGFLVKPVTKSMVVDALINVFVDASETATATAAAKGEGVRLDGLKVLLVEDNEINQQIATELLEGVGVDVTVANHGRAAVDALKDGPTPPAFDVVLMDLQMPEMDGHQATALLRADPRFASLPILAMTAHATAEEREACLARGMNGHLSKPIEPTVLFETLARWHKPAGSGARPPEGASDKSAIRGIAGLDTRNGVARVGGNEKFYLKLLRQFAEQQGDATARISAALRRNDAIAAEQLAHSLRGVAGNLGAQAVQDSAGQLEKRIHENSPADAVALALAAVDAALNPLLAELKSTLAEPTATTRTPFASATVNVAETKARLAELAKLLEGFDASAPAFALEHRDALRAAFDAVEWTQFNQHLDNFALAEAHTLLEQARQASS